MNSCGSSWLPWYHGVYVHRDGIIRLSDVRLWSKPGHLVIVQTDGRRPHSSGLYRLQDVHNLSNTAVCGQVSVVLDTPYPILLFVGR